MLTKTHIAKKSSSVFWCRCRTQHTSIP